MDTPLFNRAGRFLQEHKDSQRGKLMLLVLALLVATATTVLLIKPGQAMNHTKRVLDCPVKVHQHTNACYDQNNMLICGQADYVVHIHNDDCRDDNGNLVCPLPEIPAHVHTADCFGKEKVLICGQTESEGHEHGENCYEKKRGELTCGRDETDGHQHDDDCLNEEGELICGKDEEEPHEHSDECYEWKEELTCGKQESEGHQHSNECYEEREAVVCGKLELHTHDESCYDENGNLICGQLELLEHIHSPECFREVELSNDEVAALNEEKAAEDSAEETATPTDAVSNSAEEFAISTDVAGDTVEELATPTDEVATDTELDEEAGDEIIEGADGTFTRVFKNNEVEISVTYTEEAKIPRKAKLKAWPASQEEIRRSSTDTPDEEMSFAYMVGFYVGDEEIEPEAPVDLKIHFLTGPLANEKNLWFRHYASTGVEDLSPEVTEADDGRTEVEFEMGSFSLVVGGRSENVQLDKNNWAEGVQYLLHTGSQTAEILNLDHTAVKYHIPSFVHKSGKAYEVVDLDHFTAAEYLCGHGHYRDDAEVVIDDALVVKALGTGGFTLTPMAQTPGEWGLDVSAMSGKLQDENTDSSTYIWKSASYDSEKNEAKIDLSYFQGMRKTPLDFIFVFDDTGTMWCGPKTKNGIRARQTLWSRFVLQAAVNSLLTAEGYDVRAALIDFADHTAISSGFSSSYDELKTWMYSHFMDGCTYHSNPISRARELAVESKSSGRTPVVVYLSDFAAHSAPTYDKDNNRTMKDWADGLKADAEVYTISIEAANTYGYAATMASDSDHMFAATSYPDALDAIQGAVEEAVGTYISRDTQMTDGLSGPLRNAASVPIYTSADSNGTLRSSGSTLTWTFVDASGNRLKAGQLYHKTFSIPLNGNAVYSGDLFTNTGVEVTRGRTLLNQITESPILGKPVEVQVLNKSGRTPVEGVAFELRRQNLLSGITALGDPVWTGTTDANGMISIPYSANDSDGARFEPGSTYVLVQKPKKMDDTWTLDENSWTLSVDNNYKVTSSVATSLTNVVAPENLKAEGGKFRAYVQAPFSGPRTHLTLRKVWEGKSSGLPESISFQVYGVTKSGEKIAVPIYNSENLGSPIAGTLTASDKTQVLGSEQNWAKIVFVPKYQNEKDPFVSYDVVEDKLPDTSDGAWAEPQTEYVKDGVTTINLEGKNLPRVYDNGTLDGERLSVIFRIPAEEELRRIRYAKIKYRDGTTGPEYIALVRFNELRSVVSYHYNTTDVWRIYNVRFRSTYKPKASGLSFIVENRDGTYTEYPWNNKGTLEIKDEGAHYSSDHSEYDLDANQNYALIAYQKEVKVEHLLTLTNTFIPNQNLTLSSNFVDKSIDVDSTKLIDSVTYTVYQDGRAYGVYNATAAENFQTSVQAPPGHTYTVTQDSYTLTDGTVVPANEMKQFAAYQVEEPTEGSFVNTRRVYDTTVQTTWSPELESGEDPLKGEAITYTLHYLLTEAETPQSGEGEGQSAEQPQSVIQGANSKANGWKAEHKSFPGYRVDGRETECALVNETELADLLPDYDTAVKREFKDGNLVFTIANTWKRGRIYIEKRWLNNELAEGEDAAYGHTSVVVQVKEYVGSNTQDAVIYDQNGDAIQESKITLSPENDWSATIYADVGKRFCVQEIQVDGADWNKEHQFTGMDYVTYGGEESLRTDATDPVTEDGISATVINESRKLNVYWVRRQGDHVVAMVSDTDLGNWWGTHVSDINEKLTLDADATSLIKAGGDSSIWVPDSLPEPDGKYHLCGYGIGPSYGTIVKNTDQNTITQPEELDEGVNLEWICSDVKQGMGLKWQDNAIRYGTLSNGVLDPAGTMEGKAIYLVYDEYESITVRKVWQDRKTKANHQPITFTITPQGGETIDGLFQLSADNAIKPDENGNTVWQKTFQVPSVATGTGYTVKETAVAGYAATYSQSTAEDGTIVITITNIEGVELPSTGGTGTYLYTIGGSAILAGGLLYGLQLRRRREGTAE